MSPLIGELAGDKLSAEELIAKGKRELLCSQISNAVECFQMACQLLAEKHGDLHDELAVPNLLYGTALLKLSRYENHILGEGVENQAEPDPSSEDELEENVMASSQSISEIANSVAEVGKAEIIDIKEINSKENTNCQTEKSEDEKNDSEEESEEVSTLQLAWEVVEVAKNLFNRHDDSEHQLKASDCLQKLAEIGQEIGNHEQAISDLLECLEIRSKYASEHHRLIAETHFQLAVSYSQIGNIASSDAAFADALKSLAKCKSKLESQQEELKKDAESNKINIDRLEMQIKDVSELITEVSERRKENFEPIQTVEEQLPQPANKIAPIEDISHLVKKKRQASNGAIHRPTKNARTDGYLQETESEQS